MVKCNFCGTEIQKGSGKLYAKKDGSTYYFCSNKCEKSTLMKRRKSVETKWTSAYHKLKQTTRNAKSKEAKQE